MASEAEKSTIQRDQSKLSRITSNDEVNEDFIQEVVARLLPFSELLYYDDHPYFQSFAQNELSDEPGI